MKEPNDLSERDDGGPAFPVPMGSQHNPYACAVGLSMRDWFAGQALAGMHASLTDTASWPDESGADKMAAAAYLQADAMIKLRNA